MPRMIGDTIPERMCFTFTPQNRKDVQEDMNQKKHATVSGCINTALRFYFENRDKNQDDMMAEFLQSPKGKDIIIACIQHYDVEKKEQELKKQ